MLTIETVRRIGLGQIEEIAEEARSRPPDTCEEQALWDIAATIGLVNARDSQDNPEGAVERMAEIRARWVNDDEQD